MPTFGVLRTRLRNDVLSEADITLYSEEDLLTFLAEASVEIASVGGFPVVSSASNIASGSTTVTATASLSNVEFKQVTFNSLPLDEVDAKTVRLYQGIGGLTRYYSFDGRQGGNIDIAPAANKAGSFVVDYVKDLSGESYSASDLPWDGLLDDWHDSIIYWAAVKAFERSLDYDRAQYWSQKFDRRAQSLAVFLQNDNLLNLVGGQGAANAGR